MAKPLTELQQDRLVTAAYFLITTAVARSMPALAKRGLAERYEHDGRQYWRLTPAGLGEAVRLKGARQAAERAARLAAQRP